MAAKGAAISEGVEKRGKAAALPVTFASTVGLFTPSQVPASTAVLFLSPWGFEEMCTRKFWRILAENLADCGIPSLRFDYAGTGDALDVSDYSAGLDVWRGTAIDAARLLRSLSGCKRLILVGQGLGCAIASDLAPRLDDVAGIAFLAPVVSGRHYLRELSIWSKMVDESIGLAENQRETGGVSVAGLRMPDAIAASVRKLDLLSTDKLPAADCLVVERTDRPSDRGLASHLEALGARVTSIEYKGYGDLVSNPSIAAMPLETGAGVVEWAQSIAVQAVPAHVAGSAVTRPLALVGDGFSETPLRFGKANRLFGVLCEPAGPRRGATVILLTTAYDRHAGWGRSSVLIARQLALEGIASLRFDNANVADSPPNPAAPDQVLYASEQNGEITEAFDLLEARNLLPAMLVGRCSGGYLAFQGSVMDPRTNGLVAVNPYVFHWDETRSVEDSLRAAPRSLETYGQKFLQLETLKRLWRGTIDAKTAARNIVKVAVRRFARLRRPFLDTFAFLSKERSAIMGSFQLLAARKVRVSLIYSAHDVGLEQFSLHFGPEGAGLRRFSNTRFTLVPDADHNLTQAHAQAIYLNEVRAMSLRIGAGHEAAVSEAPSTVISRRYAR
ncbi:alpha/beta fold hydrolase [Rhizobium sp. BK251]|uniref:alpha/beta fold hydrolase n=1 Tax=Rhizobium sp. BK251 TaxID=2512125 RepID=UPI0010CF7DC8|nr:alpha/beta fold hydrolase [Rhizobium sp. BK251]TCL72953.1 hypothetical protein EV286_104382 [Rhizobium sp. BK251]